MVDERGGDAAGYLGWFFLGAVAGAAAALLLAPKSGTETRELLSEHSQEWFKKAQEVAEEAQGRAGDLFDKGREYVEEQRNRLLSAFEAGRSGGEGREGEQDKEHQQAAGKKPAAAVRARGAAPPHHTH